MIQVIILFASVTVLYYYTTSTHGTYRRYGTYGTVGSLLLLPSLVGRLLMTHDPRIDPWRRRGGLMAQPETSGCGEYILVP